MITASGSSADAGVPGASDLGGGPGSQTQPAPDALFATPVTKIVWEVERILVEDGARPIIFHGSAATCWHPHLKNFVLHQNSIYNNWRFESAWLDK